MNVRRLVAGDEEALRTLRLQALSDAPDAFGSTYEREVGRTTEDWRRWLSNDAIFVVEHPSRRPVGLAAGARSQDDPAVAYLRTMWVHPSCRRSGGANALVAAVLAWAAAAGADIVRLHVVKSNDAAIRLYERHRFQPTGRQEVRERDGVVEVEMEHRLPPEAPC